MRKIAILAWGLLVFLYAFRIYSSYLSIDLDLAFGYSDHQLYWQTLHDFLNGKVLYKNMFWEYSLLPILIRLPFFLILQKSFFASHIINFIIIPIIGVILSFYIGKQLLRGKALFLFGLLLLLMGTNLNISSIRYLIPELGLILTIIGMEKADKRKTFIGSIIMGISLLTSVEYVVASQITLAVYFFSTLIRKKRIGKDWLLLAFIELLIGSAFLVYLITNNALQNLVRFHLEYINAFYSLSPCRAIFPRLSDFFSSNANLTTILSSWNYYFIPLFLLVIGTWLFLKKNIRFKMAFIILTFYSILVSYRIITTPCYYSYGMTFPFLIICYFIFQASISQWTRRIFIGIAIWFIITISLVNFIPLPTEWQWQNFNKTNKEFLPVANIFLSKKFARQYKSITAYIQTHTNPEEYVYTYRAGPYNELTKRKSPVSVRISSFSEIVPFLTDLTVSELKQNPPSYIVINTYNGESYSNALSNIRSNFYKDGDAIIFEGVINPIEDYISQHYIVDKVYDIAWILKRRSKPTKIIKYYVPIGIQVQWSFLNRDIVQNTNVGNSILEYSITGKNPTIYIMSPQIKEADNIQIPIKINLGLIKPFSKFILNFFLVTNTGQIIQLHKNFVPSDWSEQWIYIPRKESLPKGTTIEGVAISISDNYGFLPWGRPKTINLNLPRLFIINSKK